MGLAEELADCFGDDNMLKMDGFDDCIVGIVVRNSQPNILCYSIDKVIAKLISQGMTKEEAEEYFDFNQLGAYMGAYTPCFIIEIEEGKVKKRKIGRDAKTGRFIPVEKAVKDPDHTTVESIEKKSK